MFQRRSNGLGRVLEIFEFAGEVAIVGSHVKVPVAGKVEKDRPGFAALPAAQRLVNGRPDGVVGLGCGE